MVRRFDGWTRYADGTQRRPGAVSFIRRLTASPAFGELFREGMTLVEQAAAYLDGPGRAESSALPRAAALAYAAESMRLTTRLTQVIAWLLQQRAINEGGEALARAVSERRRMRFTRQDFACTQEDFGRLPPALRALCRRSLRIQDRILHLEQGFVGGPPPEPTRLGAGVASHLERLRAEFPN